jgi:uncharacterized membrane protein
MSTAVEATSMRDRETGASALTLLLMSATVLTGLLAGFFYAYACSVMVGLARTDDYTFVATMQWINATVRNAAYAPAFFGSLLLTTVAAAIAMKSRRRNAGWVVTAAALYGAALLVTMMFNVPLNDALTAAGAPDQIADLAGVRDDFEGPWVTWNLVRTVFATGALAALCAALLRHPAERG